MKKIILSIVAFVILAIALIGFMIIRSFDADNYKTQIVNGLATLTGKKVEEIKINGETTLTWTPAPTFVMNNLTIANQAEGSEPEMFKVDQVQVEMEWMSFFKSPLVIKRIILKKPDVLVERKYTYQTNFSFPVLFQLNRQVDSTGVVQDLDMASIRIDELKIEEGTLRWKNLLTNNSFTLSDINGVGSAKSLDGPYAFKGKTKYLKQNFLIDVQTGKMQISTPLRVSLKVSDESQKSWLDLSADLNQDSRDKWFFGGGSFSFEKPKTLLASFGLKDWYEEGSLSGSYKINVAPKKVDLSDVVLSQKKGEDVLFSCVFNLVKDYNEKKTHLDIKRLNLQQLDTTLWQNIFNSFNLKNTQQATSIKMDVEHPVSSGELGDKLSLSAILSQGKLDGELVVAYPRETSISLKGKYDLNQNHLLAETIVGSSDMLGLLQSFSSFKTEAIPQESLKNVHLEGQLDFSPSLYQYNITKGSIDDTTLLGKIGYAPEQKSWITDLRLKDLDLDRYYPVDPAFLSKLYKILLGQEKQSISFDGNYQIGLNVEKIRLLGIDFADLKMQGHLTPTLLDISALSLTSSEEDHWAVSGKTTNFGTSEVAFDSFEVSGAISDFELAKKIGFVLPQWLTENHKNLTGSVKYSGTLAEGKVEAQMMADSAELSLVGAVKNLFDMPLFDQTDVHFKYPNISHLAHLVNPERVFFAKMPVSVDFQTKLSTTKKEIQWQDGVLLLGDDCLNTQGSLELKPFKLQSDIKATRFNTDIILPDILSEIYSVNDGFTWPKEEMSINVSFLSDILQYQGMQLNNLNTQFSVENNVFDLKKFSVVFPENKQSLLDISAQGQFDEMLSVKGKAKMKDIPFSNQLIVAAGYTLGGGLFSTEFDFSATGKTYENLRHSLLFQAPFTWKNATIEGVDVSAWQEAVESALKMAQMTTGFKSRLEFAFKNGKTKLPTLTGTVQSKDGTIKFSQVKGQNHQVSLDGSSLDWIDIGNTMHLNLSFVLKSLQKSLPIILDITGQSSTLKMYDFTQSFQDNVKVEAQRLSEIQKQAQKKEAEERRQYIQKNATDIFAQTDALVQSLEKKVMLNPFPKANEKMKSISKRAKEVRQLAAKTNLSETENTALLEKSKLLFAEAKDFENWLGAEDLMAQKETAKEMPEKSEKLLNKMEKIYQQNPRSVVMANLIVNSRQANLDIQNLTDKLDGAKTEPEVQKLLSSIKDNFLKLQKASEYMEKLNDSLLGDK